MGAPLQARALFGTRVPLSSSTTTVARGARGTAQDALCHSRKYEGGCAWVSFPNHSMPCYRCHLGEQWDSLLPLALLSLSNTCWVHRGTEPIVQEGGRRPPSLSLPGHHLSGREKPNSQDLF